jgi:uncharacterized protein YoaH (UPF0181 family)
MTKWRITSVTVKTAEERRIERNVMAREVFSALFKSIPSYGEFVLDTQGVRHKYDHSEYELDFNYKHGKKHVFVVFVSEDEFSGELEAFIYDITRKGTLIQDKIYSAQDVNVEKIHEILTEGLSINKLVRNVQNEIDAERFETIGTITNMSNEIYQTMIDAAKTGTDILCELGLDCDGDNLAD